MLDLARANAFGGSSALLGHLVANHRCQPIAESPPSGIVSKDVAFLEDLQDNVLDDFLGRMFRAAVIPGQGMDHGPVSGEELVPGQHVGTRPAVASVAWIEFCRPWSRRCLKRNGGDCPTPGNGGECGSRFGIAGSSNRQRKAAPAIRYSSL